MYLIPYAKIIFKSQLPVEDIMGRIRENTEPERITWFKALYFDSNKRFVGSVKGHSFSFFMILDGPWIFHNRISIKGCVHQGSDHNTIQVVLRPLMREIISSAFTFIFLLVFFLFLYKLNVLNKPFQNLLIRLHTTRRILG